jgi:hypothetical protein
MYATTYIYIFVNDVHRHPGAVHFAAPSFVQWQHARDALHYWAVSEMEDSPKSGEIARTAPPGAHDAQLFNGPIGASIRVREVPIQQCQRLTSHSTQLWS